MLSIFDKAEEFSVLLLVLTAVRVAVTVVAVVASGAGAGAGAGAAVVAVTAVTKQEEGIDTTTFARGFLLCPDVSESRSICFLFFVRGALVFDFPAVTEQVSGLADRLEMKGGVIIPSASGVCFLYSVFQRSFMGD